MRRGVISATRGFQLEGRLRPMHAHPHGEREAGGEILVGLRLATILAAAILIVEVLGAVASRSLSLSVDAVHNAPDILGFAISWLALRGLRAGSTEVFTFGTHRREVFAAMFNGILVLATGLSFGWEALSALRPGAPAPGPVEAVWLLAAAIPTLALRGASLAVLSRIPGRVRDLNVRSVLVHLASDMAITAALIIDGAILALYPTEGRIDAIAALFIAAVLVYEAGPLILGGFDVLTERTPRTLSVERLRNAAREIPGVSEIHDVHVWAVCSALVCLTAHVEVRDMTLRESQVVVHLLRQRMEGEFGIVHSTFEVETTVAPSSRTALDEPLNSGPAPGRP